MRSRSFLPIRAHGLRWAVWLGMFAAVPLGMAGQLSALAAEPVAATTPSTTGQQADAAIKPSDRQPRIGPAGRAAVLAFRTANYVGKDMRIGDGYVDGGHRMKIYGDGNVRSSREVLCVDRARDKPLQEQLKFARGPELKKLSPLDRATRLARHVVLLYTPREGIEQAEQKTAVLHTAHRNREVLLGDVPKITGGAGVCRHRSLMFKLLADEAGLKVALVRGRYGRDPATAGYHAWNELYLPDGRMLIVDTMNPQPDFHFPDLKSRQAPRYYTGDRQPMYVPAPQAAQPMAAAKLRAKKPRPVFAVSHLICKCTELIAESTPVPFTYIICSLPGFSPAGAADKTAPPLFECPGLSQC